MGALSMSRSGFTTRSLRQAPWTTTGTSVGKDTLTRFVENSGAVTVEEVRAAVKDAWKAITDEMVVKISKVRQNMLKVIALKGGNFYHE